MLAPRLFRTLDADVPLATLRFGPRSRLRWRRGSPRLPQEPKEATRTLYRRHHTHGQQVARKVAADSRLMARNHARRAAAAATLRAAPLGAMNCLVASTELAPASRAILAPASRRAPAAACDPRLRHRVDARVQATQVRGGVVPDR